MKTITKYVCDYFCFKYIRWIIFLCCLFLKTQSAIANKTALAISLNVTTTNPSCGKNNGIIEIQASGGVAPYSFTITGFPPRSYGFFSYLNPGVYAIIVTDDVGTVANSSATLTNAFVAPGASATYTNSSGCMSNNASITVSGFGGVAPYQYTIDGIQFQSTNLFSGLTSGSYLYKVKDANGCESQPGPFNNLLIPENCPIKQNGITLSYTCDPFLTYLGLINVSGGTPPYMCSLDGLNYIPGTNFPNGVPAGRYTIWIKDAIGDILKFTVAVPDRCNPAFLVTAVSQNAICNNNGSITITATNGGTPYQYSLDGISYQTSNIFSNLAAGTYTIRVKDNYNQISSIAVIINYSCITVTATSVSSNCGNSNGSITVNASNGTLPYLYSIDGINFVTNNVFTGLLSGTYTIKVKDAAGNSNSINITISDINAPIINSVVSTPTDCEIANGTITINSNGGTPPLTYSIDGITYRNTPLFTALPAGSYTSHVKDANGCTTQQITTITQTNTIIIDAGTAAPICEGEKITLSGSTNSSQFFWSPSSTLSDPLSLNPVATPINSTIYYLTGTTGTCSKKDSVLVIINPAPVADAGTGSTICPGKNTFLSASGGVSCLWTPSTYLNNPSSFTPIVLNPLTNITYSLRVTDIKGCSSVNKSTATISVTPAPIVFAGSDTSISINQPLQLHALDVNAIGFNQFIWFPASGLSSSSIQNPIAVLNSNRTFIISAKTPSGCIGSDTINIRVFKKPDIFVPNTFTPNGDGKNDILRAIPVGIKTFKYFIIYDRYGTKIFQTSKTSIGWEGKVNGKLYNSGSFVWIASGIDYLNHEILKKGSVILLH